MKILDLGGVRKAKESEDIITVNIGGLGDIEYDLNNFPYPFKDNVFDEVRIYHVLEHLEKPIKVMEEVWRILKPNGIVKIKIPYWKLLTTFENPFHLHEFKEGWFKNLSTFSSIYCKNGEVLMRSFLPKVNFKLVKTRKQRGRYKFWKIYELEIWMKKINLNENPYF
ncbi:MAG: hypothetical protein DRP13_01055 [Candidatus Aenigmatarchaeota archaeon]|nr:MAG: hypothetical protein DRP13_01055 [Candidatus Aenigmarchaeota archaeon]